MADSYPNIDEFGRGACTCNGTMTGCAVCSTANILVRYKKAIPRLSDGTPDMRALGRRMGARHRAATGAQHGRSLDGRCSPPYSGTNWCAYCGHLELKANGLPSYYQQLSWAAIEQKLIVKHPIILPGRYGRFPVVSESSYSSTKPARGRSDTGFIGSHMVTAWQIYSRTSTGAVRDFVVSDPDFGSPSRPTVPPHSIISRSALRNYWEANGKWAVCYVNKVPPALAPAIVPWWGSDVKESITLAYAATTVAAKLRTLGISNYGKALNNSDLEAGLKKRRIYYGTTVDLIDVRALMQPGTGKP